MYDLPFIITDLLFYVKWNENYLFPIKYNKNVLKLTRYWTKAMIKLWNSFYYSKLE